MLDLLLAIPVVLVLGVLACLVAVAATVVPFVLGLDMAERRDFSTARWGAIALVGAGAAGVLLLLAITAHSTGSVVWVALAGIAGWATPGLLSLLSRHETEVGGASGAHEH